MPDALSHAKEYSPMYAIIVLLGGGGGFAALTDNLPVTQAEFAAHNHAQLSEQVQSIYEGQLRQRLMQAYSDRCKASSPDAIKYIDHEIQRLKLEYQKITGRPFNQPPCL